MAGRFTILETAVAAPGVCRVCGGASKDWYVDLGYNEEYYGAVYYCCECIEAMAHACGFLTPVERKNLEAKVEELESSNFAFKVRTDGLERALDGLRSAGFLVSRDPDWADAGIPEAPVMGEGSQPSEGSDVGTRAGATAEPDDESGLADVRASGGVEEPVTEFRLAL